MVDIKVWLTSDDNVMLSKTVLFKINTGQQFFPKLMVQDLSYEAENYLSSHPELWQVYKRQIVCY